jgi:hypothetical protein
MDSQGLMDSHVLAIVDGLSTPGTSLDYLDADFTVNPHVTILNLESNPGITSQGYGALFNLVNRANVVGIGRVNRFCRRRRRGLCVDDKTWEGELNLVSEMNSKFSRLEYLTNGTFTSEERRWQWLERAANLPRPYDWDEGQWDDWGEEHWNAEHLNFIWYTLRQNPQMMQT